MRGAKHSQHANAPEVPLGTMFFRFYIPFLPNYCFSSASGWSLHDFQWSSTSVVVRDQPLWTNLWVQRWFLALFPFMRAIFLLFIQPISASNGPIPLHALLLAFVSLGAHTL